jgi:hypothetical protein
MDPVETPGGHPRGDAIVGQPARPELGEGEDAPLAGGHFRHALIGRAGFIRIFGSGLAHPGSLARPV